MKQQWVDEGVKVVVGKERDVEICVDVETEKLE